MKHEQDISTSLQLDLVLITKLIIISKYLERTTCNNQDQQVSYLKFAQWLLFI